MRQRVFRILFAACMVAVIVSPPAMSAPAEDKQRDEVEQLKLSILDHQNKGKLGFRKVVACSSAEGFGLYSPLESGQPLSNLILYFEPANVSTLISADRYVTDCSVDVLVVDATGKPLGGKPGLKISRVSRSPAIDLWGKFGVNLGKVVNKNLIIKIVLHDKIKNQSVTASYRINTDSPGKKLLDPI